MQVSIRIAIAIAIVIARDVGLLHVEQTRLGSLGAWLGRLLSSSVRIVRVVHVGLFVSRQNLTIEK